MTELTGRAKGGAARAAKLTAERRKEIAMKAVDAKRARASAVKITHTGIIKLGGVEIPCYVTDKGGRLLSGRGMQDALRLVDEDLPNSQKSGSRMDRFVTSNWAKTLIYKNKETNHFAPINALFGSKYISGYNAEVLADVCEAMLEAKDLGLLNTPRRAAIGQQCELLVRGFFRVGIVALVDEATGYQKERAKDELAKILEAFVAKEMQPWVKTFPVSFYEQMCRLRGIEFNPTSVKRPLYFGHLTNDVVYRRLAPGVWLEIKERSKKLTEDGHKGKLHQLLTSDLGHPKLKELITSVTTIMKLSDNWLDFKLKLDRVHTPYLETLPLDFNNSIDDGLGL